MNKKIYKQMHKKLKKEISEIKKEKLIKDEIDEKFLDVVEEIILKTIFRTNEKEGSGDRKKILSFALFSKNILLDRLIEKSNLKQFHNCMSELEKNNKIINKAIEIFDKSLIKGDSFYDFIVINMYLVILHDMGFSSKIRKFLNNDNWLNSPAIKLLNYLDNKKMSLEKQSLSEFLEHVDLILLMPSNIGFFFKSILKYQNANKEEIEILEYVKNFIKNVSTDPITNNSHEKGLVWFLEVLISTYNNEPGFEKEPSYLAIEFLKNKINVNDFLGEISDSNWSIYNISDFNIIIWSSILLKLSLYPKEENKNLFSIIFLNIYKKYRKKDFFEYLINYISLCFIVESSKYHVRFFLLLLNILESKEKLTKLEIQIWNNIILGKLINKKEFDLISDIVQKHNLSIQEYKIFYNEMLSKRNNKEVLEFIEKPSFDNLKLESYEKIESIKELEKSRINKKEVDLDKIIKKFDDEESLRFLKTIIFDRYNEKNNFILNKNSKIFLKEIYNAMLQSSITLIKSDKKAKNEIENSKNKLKNYLSKFEKNREKINFEIIEPVYSYFFIEKMNTTLWKFIHKIKIQVNNEAIFLEKDRNYLISVIDFIAFLKNKTLKQIDDFFDLLKIKNIKIYFLKSQINRLTQDTITDGVINGDDIIQRIMNIEEELRLIQLKAEKSWEHILYWKIINNLSNIFKIVYDINLLQPYYYDNKATINKKSVKIIKSEKIKKGILELMFNIGGLND
ncbi:MAG: hypothetical protein GY679_03945 [Mycoplasma sp.]|nr:hypothetical protein [Mycoplasma sp.]